MVTLPLSLIKTKKNKEKQILDIKNNNVRLQPKIIFNDGNGTLKSGKIEINPEETVVVVWE